MRKFIVPSLMLTMLFIGGCQANDDASNYDLRKDRSAPNEMSNKYKKPLVGQDVQNQNPNFLNLEGTSTRGTGGGQDTGIDVGKAKKVIRDTHEFRTDSVWINGDRMWVNVYKKGMLNDQQRENAEARLHKKLVQALPRYNIEVRVQEDRR